MVSDNSRATLTVEKAAEYMGIGRSLCYELLRRGEIPAIRLGSRWLIPKARLDEMLNQAGRQEEEK